MPFQFRKRVRLLPGVWLNLGKTGISTSIGGDGVTVNYGKRGTRTTLTVPGTGLSYTQSGSPTQQAEDGRRRSGPLTRALAVVLWTFLILYLVWAMR